LRKVCEDRGIKVPFKPEADKVAASALWEGIVQRQRSREEDRKKGTKVPDFVPLGLETDLDIMRTTVLNRLSHTGSSGLVHADVDAAIKTVEAVVGHAFPNASP